MNRMRVLRSLALALGLTLAAAILSCNASVGVGISYPVGSSWSGGPYGSASIGAPVGH